MTPNRLNTAATGLLLIALALPASACGDEYGDVGATSVAASPNADTSDAQAICDQYTPRVEEGWVTVRAETATAEDVAAWQEEISRRSGGEIVSLYRQRPPTDELTVCLYWGFVPAPGGPPDMTLPPYDASTWVIDADGNGMPVAAGWKASLTELPSDILASE